MKDDIFGKLESEIRRVARLAKDMGMTFSIVSRMLVLQREGALVIVPMPRSYVEWHLIGDWQLCELLYSRSYRRRSTDYGEQKEVIPKSRTRKEIYAQWDDLANRPPRDISPLRYALRAALAGREVSSAPGPP